MSCVQRGPSDYAVLWQITPDSPRWALGDAGSALGGCGGARLKPPLVPAVPVPSEHKLGHPSLRQFPVSSGVSL